MNVLFLNYEYPPIGGGAGNATKYLLNEYSKIKELRVDLITSALGDRIEEEKISENISLIQLPIRKKDIHFWTQRETISYALAAQKYIKKSGVKYEVCHAFSGVPCGFIAQEQRKKQPYIVSLRGSDVPGFNNRFALQYVFLKPLIRRMWKHASAVVANSEGLKELALKTNPNQKIDVIPNGIDTAEFKPGKKKNDTFRIITVSRLIERKGIHHLIDAAPKVLKENPDTEFVIIGEGDLEQNLKEQVKMLGIEKNIKFMGYMPHEKLPEIYANSSVFVLPSQNEGMSNTIMEAMAAGLPVITTETGGSKELIKDGINGKIIKQNNSQEIADAIISYAQDKNKIMSHGHSSREKALNMSWENVAKNYAEKYAEIIR
ncbi:Glycosyltransferase Gtf1 [uncultured archaeon]|nr:Glycosyltransferase Gtf1 [uncultured archaeon]